jgi:membrane protein YdbS with pleckstrin-like domain
MPEGALAGLIATALRVPARPEPPLGSAGSLAVFNAAPGYYRYRLLGWSLGQAGTAIGLVVGLVVLSTVEIGPLVLASGLLRLIEILGVVGFIAQLPFSLLLVTLDFRYRWYMVTDTSLRIREGVLTVREQTMTLANIQQLSIRQGPLQRLFGIADLQVRTAGGGERADAGSAHHESPSMHLGAFRGVDNAERIRDLIVASQRRLRDAGLGDPDEEPSPCTQGEGEAAGARRLAAAAAELRAEASRLRAVFPA